MTVKPFNEPESEAEDWCKDEDVVQVNKWDQSELKNTLDDAVRKIFVDRYGCAENNSMVDRRLTLGCISVLLAGFALIYDYILPFPLSKAVLGTCAGTYFVLMALITVYMIYVEKGVFLVINDGRHNYRVSSSMKKYDPVYSLRIDNHDVGSYESLDQSSVSFFDDQGHFHLFRFYRTLKKVYTKLDSKKAN